MAASSWVESAAYTPGLPVGVDRMDGSHLLAMPAAERAYALKELERARRAVLRIDRGDPDDLLDALGLPALTEEERIGRALERERERLAATVAREQWPQTLSAPLPPEVIESIRESIGVLADALGFTTTTGQEDA